MKHIKEFSVTIRGGYLSQKEVILLRTVVKKICDNHPDDDFWKINDSIKRVVSSELSFIEADQEYDETCAEEEMAEEEAVRKLREEEEKEEQLKEETDKLVDQILK
jgi:hypothetical protein